MATIRTTGDEAAAAATSQARESATNILDLPAETQREIVSHCSQGDLICLALVCKRFHELASAQLYRNFHIIFPDDDDLNFDSPIDGLAGGLDTFTTSEYNYAKHLKDLSMDTLSAGIKGENSYQPYLYSASCGKFLNTLLLLTLKRAHSLESFRWNIRVELSRPVYAQLHRIRSLKRLHIRLQAGDSYYLPPPPLPVTTDHHTQNQVHGHGTENSPPSQSLGYPTTIPPPGSPPLGPPPAAPLPRPSPKYRPGRRGPDNKEPPTLAGFKGLKSLSVLDIDNLDIIPELKACVKNSYSTLKELQISLSDGLAQLARRPPADSDEGDSDDDEFHVAASADNANNYDSSGPSRIFRAQEEKKLQESILNKVFDIDEPHRVNRSPLQLSASMNLQAKSETRTDGPQSWEESRQDFIASLRSVSTRLMSNVNGSKDFSISQQEILDTIEKAARKYVESEPKEDQVGGDASHTLTRNEVNISTGTSNTQQETSKNVQAALCEGGTAMIVNEDTEATLSSSRPWKNGDHLSPDDIDIEHLEMVDEYNDEFEDSKQMEAPSLSGDFPSRPRRPPGSEHTEKSIASADNNSKSIQSCEYILGPDCKLRAVDRVAVIEKLAQLHRLVNDVGQRVLEIRDERISEGDSTNPNVLDSELALLNRSAIEVSNEIRILESEIEEMLNRPVPATHQDLKQDMDTYSRSTRGLSIETLKICMVPVKASVLSQAVDVACIKELTLINVGNQAPIWSMLSKEQRVRPIALRSVFTDHVSASFLACIAQLPVLDDLFMLERSMKSKPESFAPRTATSIDQIRRLVLKKHMSTLKRLMIKDESNGPNWDANEKTMILVCTQGAKLEELSLSMNIHAVHAFMQYFSGMVSLRAINILHFRNSDTCIWVMREILRFIVDNLSHHPELRLEWIAIEDDRVDRVVRPTESSTESSSELSTKRNKDKGKKNAHAVPSTPGTSSYPLIPLHGLDSESESEDEHADSGSRLRFKTVGPLQFYDVWGVKIFDKEIRSGKL